MCMYTIYGSWGRAKRSARQYNTGFLPRSPSLSTEVSTRSI